MDFSEICDIIQHRIIIYYPCITVVRVGWHMRLEKDLENIRKSLERQAIGFDDELILNPVENIPPKEALMPNISFLTGLYNSDKMRDNNAKKNTKIQFSNRDAIAEDINKIYRIWAEVLNAEKVSIRMFSGLHAHTVIFMALTKIGDAVLLLPEEAGGHMATKSILERLGVRVFEFAIDYDRMQVDVEKTRKIIEHTKPLIAFFDRSEGLKYEDLTWLSEYNDMYKIFDASQYLTNILSDDYKSPFDMGFDAIISTLHKNFPGPQRTLFCTKVDDEMWRSFESKIGTYVSNMHPYGIYAAGLMLEKYDELRMLSKLMLANTKKLDEVLSDQGLDIVKRSTSEAEPLTHHIWVNFPTKEDAFEFFLKMERLKINVNYRLLPYELGYGIRMGLSGATVSGLTAETVTPLGTIIAKAYQGEPLSALKQEAAECIRHIKQNYFFKSKG